MTKIYLIGMMGSGKTTVGKLLSKELGFDFVDTDAIVEDSVEQTVYEFFSTQGEALFREIESATLEVCANYDDIVISTGGGIVVKGKNCEIMKREGVVIFLDASAEEIVRRLEGDTTRPLLNEDIGTKITDLTRARFHTYEEMADVIVLTDKLTPEGVVVDILGKLSGIGYPIVYENRRLH